MKQRTHQSIILTVILLLNFQFIGTVNAKNGEQGSSNGQPFKTIQSQIDLLSSDFEAAITNLQNQVDSAVTNLQQQIDDLEASQAAQDVLISTIQTAVALLRDRVTVNEDDIAALQAASSFQAQLIQALDDRLTTLENRVTANEDDIAAIILADQTTQALIVAIQDQINTLGLRISANDGDIAALQSQVATLNTMLSSVQAQLSQKQNRVNGVCSAGSSIRIIYSNGSVVCEPDTVSAGVGTFQQLTVSKVQEIPGALLLAGTLSLTATCPSTYRVTGGGYNVTGITGTLVVPGDPRLVAISRTVPSGSTAWNALAINDNVVVLGSGRVNLRVYASCGRVQ